MNPTEDEFYFIYQVLIDNNYNPDGYSQRYRGNCLKQVLRKIFYDTLLIIENDYNPYKYNEFIVVGSSKIMTEIEWCGKKSVEEEFTEKAIKSLKLW